MHPSRRMDLFGWLYEHAQRLTNWARVEFYRAKQDCAPVEVPHEPLAVLFPVDKPGDPVEQGFIRKGEPVETTTIDGSFAAFQQTAANDDRHG